MTAGRLSSVVPHTRPAAAIALFAAVLVMALVWAPVASAHAVLVRSDPPENAIVDPAPGELRLWFSEALEPVFSEVRLLDAAGQAVQTAGEPRSDPADASLLRVPLAPLEEGVYTVVWRVTSAVDGHATTGSFAFLVGSGQVPTGGMLPAAPGGASLLTPSPPELLARWLGYLGMALLGGGFAFLLLVLGPAARGTRSSAETEPRDSGADAVDRVGIPPEAQIQALRLLLLVLLAGWGITLLSTLAGAVFQAARGAGVEVTAAVGQPLQLLLGETRYGAVFWARSLALAVVGVILVAVRGGRASPAWWAGGLVASEAVLLTTSLNSHLGSDSAILSAVPVSLVVDWLHLSAVAIWVGGLVSLVFVLRRGPGPPESKPDPWLGRLVDGLSLVATFCVAAIAFTGVIRVSGEVYSPQDLVDTPWGNALLVKLALLAPLLGLAAANRFFVRGRLVSSDGRVAAPGTRWRRVLLLTVGGEVLFASVVLGATSVLTSLPPAIDAYGPGLQLRAESGDLRAVLVVNPGSPGPNSFDVYIRSGLREPVDDAEKVALIFSSAEQAAGSTEAVAEGLGEGHYRVQGSYLSMAGTWRVQLLVRRPGLEDARLAFTLTPSQLGDGAPGEHAAH